MSRREYHTLGDLNNKDLCLAVLEAEKSQIRVSVDPVPGESPLPGLQMAIFSLYPHVVKRRGVAFAFF